MRVASSSGLSTRRKQRSTAAWLLLGAAVIVLGQLLARPILLWLLGLLVKTPLGPLLVAARRETQPTSTHGADRPAQLLAPGDPLPAGGADAHRDPLD